MGEGGRGHGIYILLYIRNREKTFLENYLEKEKKNNNRIHNISPKIYKRKDKW